MVSLLHLQYSLQSTQDYWIDLDCQEYLGMTILHLVRVWEVQPQQLLHLMIRQALPDHGSVD